MIEDFRVITSDDARNEGKVWVILQSKRHYLFDFKALSDWGFGEYTLEFIPYDEVIRFPLSFPICRYVDGEKDIHNYFEARCYLLQKCVNGEGLEIGAATSPIPLPPNCNVKYCSFFDNNEGCNTEYAGEFVPISYFTSYEELSGIPDNSQDFIVSSHVIEHCRNPIKAIYQSWKKLSDGGIFFMAIPHKEYTFDRKRKLSTAKHIITDFRKKNRMLDVLHIIDVAHNANEYHIVCIPTIIRYLLGKNIDLHWHTFSEESFGDLVYWMEDNLFKWTDYKIVKRIGFEGANEFYFVAKK